MSDFIEAWGYCGDKYTEFKTCSITPDDCDIFNWNEYKPFPFVHRGPRCDPNDTKMGRCLKENLCALRSIDCPEDTEDSNFDENDEFCTYLRDTSLAWDVNEPLYTQFGSCKNMNTGEYFCIYNPSDCDESGIEVYVTPSETLNAGIACDCSEVHVTACEDMKTGVTNCAVTAESCNPKCRTCDVCGTCDATHNPFSPEDQRKGRENGVNQLDCRLCQRRQIVAPIPAPAPIPTNPSIEETAGVSSSAGVSVLNENVAMAWLLCLLVRWLV